MAKMMYFKRDKSKLGYFNNISAYQKENLYT